MAGPMMLVLDKKSLIQDSQGEKQATMVRAWTDGSEIQHKNHLLDAFWKNVGWIVG